MIEAFTELNEDNIMKTKIYRVLGYLSMVAGIYLFFSPIYTILDFLPLMGAIGEWIALVIGLLASIPLSMTVITFAWLRYRPLMAMGLLALSCVMWGILYLVVETDPNKL